MRPKKTITLKAYELCTPKFAGNKWYEEVYDYELIDLLFKSILKLNKSQRKYKNETDSINLGAYNQSADANIMEGYFLTAKHGMRRTQIDIDTQQEVGTIPRNHGIEGKVYFMIDRRTGLLLVQEDFNKVFQRKLLHSFIHYHKSLIYPYIAKYNKVNAKNKLEIHKRSCYRLVTLPPINFFNKLKEFRHIKSAILTLDNTTEKNEVDVSRILDQELEDNGITEYDMEIKIKNKSPMGMVRVFEKYFETVQDLQKYDSYAIEGILHNGRTKKITPDTLTRDFFADVEFNVNGEPSMSQVYSGMVNVITYENPLKGKGPTPNSVSVGEDKDVEKNIQSLIDERNQDSSSKEQES
jgi:hypothetical protein